MSDIIIEKNINNPRNILGAVEVVIGIALIIIGSMPLFTNYAYINFQSMNPVFMKNLLAIISLIVGFIHTGLGIKNIVYKPITEYIPNLKIDNLFEIFLKNSIIISRKYQFEISYVTSSIILSIIVSIIAMFFWYSIFTEAFFILILISNISFLIAARLYPKLPTPKWKITPQDISSGHPQKLYRILKDSLIELGYDQHRFKENEKSDQKLENTNVQDTGTIQGYTFMESDPKIVDLEHRKIATFSLFWAGFFIIIGFFLMVNDPLAIPMPIIGLASVLIGYDFIGKSKKLFNIMIFKSKIIFSEIKGEYYKSDLGVGKSLDDSLYSHRFAIIGDYRLTHYCANVLSKYIESEREIVTMYVSPDIENDIISFAKIVADHKKRKPDLEVQGIDLKEQSTISLLKGNLIMAKTKKIDQNTSEIDQTISETKRLKALENSAYEEIMFCPQCGTKCKDSANFCSRCGTKL